MMRSLALLLLVLFAAHPVRAADKVGAIDEVDFTGRGTVVDVSCEVAGRCVPDCGGGRHQLGILTADGKLYLAAKGAAIFRGLVPDLLPYCGKVIAVDGTTTTQFGALLLYIQRFRLKDGDPWITAEKTLNDWAAAHGVAPDSKEADEWFRHDEAVDAAVAKRGRLGVPE